MVVATTPSFLRAWWQLDRSNLLRLLGLVVSLLALVALWPSLIEVGGAGPLLGNVLVHAYSLVLLLLAGTLVRSVGTRDVLAAFLLGVFLVPALVFGASAIFLGDLPSSSSIRAIVWAPVLEESAMLLAVGLLAWRGSRRRGRRRGAYDLLLQGMAVGAGFAIHEDALYGRLVASFPSTDASAAFAGPYGWIYPMVIDQPLRAQTGEVVTVFTYHGTNAALYGLAIGVVLLLARRYPVVVWLVPAAFALGMFEHALGNYQIANGPSVLRFLTLGGHLVPLLLVLAVPLLLVLEHRRRARAELTMPPVDREALRRVLRDGDGMLDRVVRLLAIGQYHRRRNAVVHGAAAGQDVTDGERGLGGWGRMAMGGLSAN